MEPQARRAARLLAASWAVSWAGVPISGAFAGVITERLSNDPSLVGVPFAIVYIGSLLASYPAGYLMDRHGRIPVLIGGALVSAAGFAVGTVAILLGNLWLFWVGHLVSAMGAGTSYLTRLAAADLYPAHERARGVGRLLFFLAIGALAAYPLIALAERLQPALGASTLVVAWGMIPLLSLAAAFLLSRIGIDPRTIAATRTPDSEPATGAPAGRLPWRPLLAAGAALLFAQAAMASLMSVAGPHLDATGHSPRFIVLTLNLHVLGMFLFSPLVGTLGDRFGRRFLLRTSGIYLGVSALVTAAWPVGLALPGFLLAVGIGWSFAFVGATSVVSDVARVTARGRITGVIDQATAVVGGSVSFASGWLLAHHGLPSVAILAAVCSGGALLAGLLAPARSPRSLPPAKPLPASPSPGTNG